MVRLRKAIVCGWGKPGEEIIGEFNSTGIGEETRLSVLISAR